MTAALVTSRSVIVGGITYLKTENVQMPAGDPCGNCCARYDMRLCDVLCAHCDAYSKIIFVRAMGKTG